jgi:hypothetical protein
MLAYTSIAARDFRNHLDVSTSIVAREENRNVNYLIPDYLAPSVLIGSVAVVGALLIGLRKSVTASALLVAWFFAALAASWLGLYRGASTRVPTIQYGLLIPIAAGVALFWRWPALQKLIDRVPQSWVVGIQVFRVEGAVFLTLYAGGWLPGAFALPAGVGDVIVGLLAPIVAIAYSRGLRGSDGLVRFWNFLGIADLVVAVTTGILTAPSRLQLLAFDRPNELISAFPLVMIPVFLVPLAVLLHLASLEKLRQSVVW